MNRNLGGLFVEGIERYKIRLLPYNKEWVNKFFQIQIINGGEIY